MLLTLASTGALAPPFLPTTVVSHELIGLRPLVRARLARLLGVSRAHPDVDDAEAEVMRRAIEGQSRLRPGAPLRLWLFGIARHVAVDALRQRRRQQPVEFETVEHRLVHQPLDPARAIDARRRAERVRALLAELPEKQRQALELLHGEGLSYQQIAERLGAPIGSVCTWVSRARRALAQQLENDDVE
jgi:RNA polymerase sigma-70 factor (ECF subfamily)